jgi:hypothetical protein
LFGFSKHIYPLRAGSSRANRLGGQPTTSRQRPAPKREIAKLNPGGRGFKYLLRNQSFFSFQSLPQTLQPSELILVVKGYTEFVSYSEFPWSIASGLPVTRQESRLACSIVSAIAG